MNVRYEPQTRPDIAKRLLSISEASVYLGLGRNSALKFLDEIGAKHQIGRRVLYDKETIDNYLSQKKEDNKNEQY